MDKEKREEEFSSFFYRMKNSVNLPLKNIMSLTSVAKSTNDVRKIKQCLNKIDAETKKLSNLISGVLDFEETTGPTLDPFNFESMLIAATNEGAAECEERRQILQIKMDMDMPAYFIGDEKRIGQIVANLLENASSATPQGGKIQIEAALVSSSAGVATVEISVSDNGPGMGDEASKNVRDFFNGGNKELRDIGLGLAISKSDADIIGSKLELYSGDSQGTTIGFTIRLEVFESKFYGRIFSPGLNIRSLNVLLLDFSPKNCEYFKKIMKSFKILADASTTVLGFRDKLEFSAQSNKPYNIIFMEEYPEALKFAREFQENFRNSRVIFTVEKGAEPPKDYPYVTKPFFPSQILDVINEIVSLPNRGQTSYKNKKFDFYGKNILLVEDSKTNGEIAKRILRETKAHIEYAQNGAVAIQKFRSSPEKYDLILMDINMPEMDGLSTTIYLRGLPIARARTIPIIAMTANNFPKDVERFLRSGMNDHIPKPLEPDAVLNKLAPYLN
jgi:CheY-like chemotaxis protein